MSLNVIVYQYGKVASTSLVTTLNKMRGVSAHQCHFFGEEAFRATVTRLCNPDTNDYFFKHSLGQLAENLKAYRLYHRKHAAEGERCIVLTVAREPFDWFRSSLVQEIEGHIPALTLSLRDRGVESMSQEQIVSEGLTLLIERISQAIEAVEGGIDALVPAKRRELDQMLPFTDTEDFEAFLFILSRFLQPHWWFRTQFTPEFGIAISDMVDVGAGLLRSPTPTGDIYLARYEQLEPAFARLLDLEDLAPRPLARVNEGHKKPYAADIAAVFGTERAKALKAQSRSEITRTLGYE
ncbi:MAG: hypothetical protein EVA63_10645 [Halieaceae bacterium]|nr:MAG: hypothetical protein EVA63_10645 [Halieaceae bacterium]